MVCVEYHTPYWSLFLSRKSVPRSSARWTSAEDYETGKPFVDLSAGLALACQKAGITGVTWHTLRHTFASRLLDRGVDIVTVKELLGHSTVLVTMRYLHPNLEAKVLAVAKLAANCDNSVTVRPKVQQLIPKVSQIGR